MLRLFRCKSTVASIKKFAEKPTPPAKPAPEFHLPRQHAIKMNETSAEVISYKIPNRPLSPLFEVPVEARLKILPYFTVPEDSKILSVALLGPPNSGKTTLLNAILGERLFAVSRKVNTTAKNQEGIKTINNTQIVFHDTPGIISTHGELTNSISTKGWEAISECAVTFFVVDAVKMLENDVKAACSRLQKLLAPRGERDIPEAKIVGETEEQHKKRLESAPVTIPACLIVNKVDLVDDRRSVKYLVNELSEYAKFSKNFFISAEKNYNISDLIDYLLEKSTPGRWEYHPNQLTTSSDIEIAENVVRERIFYWIHDELPYRWLLRTIGWTPYLDGTLRIDMDVLVLTKVHVGIFLGKESKVIKKIWSESQSILSKIYNRKIQLNLKAKLMKDDIKTQVKRGKEIQMTHPRLPHQEQLPVHTMNKISSENNK